MRSALSILPIPLLALGCAPTEEPGEAVPPKVVFEGAVDRRAVGTWRDATGNVDMALHADGSVAFKAKAMTPAGMRSSESQGRWLIAGDRFLTQTVGFDGSPLTLDYRLRISKDSLSLERGRAKERIVYRRIR